MIRLLRSIHLPTWRQSRASLWLPIVGVALGVAAVVSIDLGSLSTVAGARRTFESINGRTTHQVVAAGGRVDPRLAWELRDRGILAAPVLEAIALGQEPLRVIGLDPFAEASIRQLGLTGSGAEEANLFRRFLGEPGAVMVSAPYLERHNLGVGDAIDLEVGARHARAVVLRALPRAVNGVDVPDNLLLCDLATAQEFTGRSDASRIDVVLPVQDRNRLLDRLRDTLPVGVALQTPGGRSQQVEGMLAALNANLRALSYLALFVSLFLIYNAMLLAVLRRRPQIGLARCLGATRGEVLGAWLMEGLLIGALGTASGLLIGTVGGRLAVAGFTRTAQDLYGVLGDAPLTVSMGTYVKASVVGLGASLFAAAFPAREAAQTPPARTASRGDAESVAARRARRAPWLAIPCLLVFLGSLVWPGQNPGWGYVAAVSFALALALITPSLGSQVLGLLRPLLGRWAGVVPAMAAENIRLSLSRTGVALAALTVALSMSIAMGTMISSFQSEMLDWIGKVVDADIYISAGTAEVDRVDARLPDELLTQLRARPSIARADTYRMVHARVRGFDTFLAGIEADVAQKETRLDVLQGPESGILLEQMQSGHAAITEALSQRLGIGPGDQIEVRLAGQVFPMRVAGVFRDYSTDRGAILTGLDSWRAMAGPRGANSVALFVADGVDPQRELEQLRAELRPEYALLLRSNHTLRAQARDVFRRTFSVANALQVIGIAVASIGILAALLAFLLERRKELATLRALGLRAHQLRTLLVAESSLMAGVAWLFALGGGTVLSWVLLRVINVRSFGWSIPMRTPYDAWGLHLLLALTAGLLATVIPWWQSRRAPIATGLREE